MTDLPPHSTELTRREAAIKSNGYNEGWCEAEAEFKSRAEAERRPAATMTDFTPTPEAVEAAAEGMEAVDSGRTNLYHESWKVLARAAIAAFVEAEGLQVVTDPGLGEPKLRLVGPWRKRD